MAQRYSGSPRVAFFFVVPRQFLARSTPLRAGLHPAEPRTGSSAPGLRRKEEIFSSATRHLRFSARCAPRDMPGYYRPSLAGLEPPSFAAKRGGFRPFALRSKRRDSIHYSSRPSVHETRFSSTQKKGAGEMLPALKCFRRCALGCDGQRSLRDRHHVIAYLAGCVLQRGNDGICSCLTADRRRAVLRCGYVITVLDS
jgi:hypothetical protein